jgi:pimeloyl-ACP methyl ester carboxylesterase
MSRSLHFRFAVTRSGLRRVLNLGRSLAAGVVILAVAAQAWSQAPAPATPPGPPTTAPTTPVIPKPEDVTLSTGSAGDPEPLALQATYYASFKDDGAVPVILLHMYNGSRADYGNLAKSLQLLGHAVLAPDLRGHGGSTKFANEALKPLSVATLRGNQFEAMPVFDVESCRIFLQSKKNVNIEKLCVVGAEMGSVVALVYALRDWSWPDLGGRKQGKYVKALVLISPDMKFRGLKAARAMADPNISGGLSILMAVGQKDGSGAQTMKSMFERRHPKPAKKEDKSFFYVPMPTSLKGTNMLGKGLGLETVIADFIDRRLVKAK